jgi:hypothetical protein
MPIRMIESLKSCASDMPVRWLSGESGKSRPLVSHCRKCKKKSASVFLTLVLSMPTWGKDEQSCKKDGCFSSVSPNCQSHITGWF